MYVSRGKSLQSLSQPNLDQTENFLLNQVCLDDPKCLSAYRFDNVNHFSGWSKRPVCKPTAHFQHFS